MFKKRFPRDLFFICSSFEAAERLARLTYEGVIASIYPKQEKAVAAYKAYPPPLKNRYGIFHIRMGESGHILWMTEVHF